MPTVEKEQVIRQTADSIRGARGIYLADFTGMTVESLSLLRKKCRDEKVQFRVVKNTLLKRAFNSHGITALDPYLVGPTGVVYSATSEVSPARILATFAKEFERPKVKAAVVDGRLFDEKEIARIAALPSREVLMSQLLGTIIAPLTVFLAAIDATLRLPAVMADVLEREKSKPAA
jgi:large subunit ribosomal protein L10